MKKRKVDKQNAAGGTIVYAYKDALYINLTNRCPCRCRYCIKYKWRWKFRGHELKLKYEPSAAEVVESVSAYSSQKNFTEVVFCGYGEPFMRFETMKEISRILKSSGWHIRINTTGLGNLINKRNVLPEISGLVDSVSVSLNSADAQKYQFWNRSVFGAKSFDAVLDFIREAKKYIPSVAISAIELPGGDIDGIKKIAASLGVNFRTRPYLDDYEDR